MLDDSNRLIDDENTIAEIFNDYFVNVTSTLNLKASESCHTHSSETNFQNHLSVRRIAESHPAGKSFAFREVGPDIVYRTLCKLNQDKTVAGPFSIKDVKMVADIVSGPVSKLVNSAFSTSVFPENLKNAN